MYVIEDDEKRRVKLWQTRGKERVRGSHRKDVMRDGCLLESIALIDWPPSFPFSSLKLPQVLPVTHIKKVHSPIEGTSHHWRWTVMLLSYGQSRQALMMHGIRLSNGRNCDSLQAPFHVLAQFSGIILRDLPGISLLRNSR